MPSPLPLPRMLVIAIVGLCSLVLFTAVRQSSPGPSPSTTPYEASPRPSAGPVVVSLRRPAALATAATASASAEPDSTPVVGTPLHAQYSAAIEAHYLPAKHAAELANTPLAWHHAYEVAYAIWQRCTFRSEWSEAFLPVQTDSPLEEPATEILGVTIDWRKKSFSTARDAVNCVQTVRSEER